MFFVLLEINGININEIKIIFNTIYEINNILNKLLRKYPYYSLSSLYNLPKPNFEVVFIHDISKAFFTVYESLETCVIKHLNI